MVDPVMSLRHLLSCFVPPLLAAAVACTSTATPTTSEEPEPARDLPNTGIAVNDGTPPKRSSNGNETSPKPRGPSIASAAAAAAKAGAYCDFWERCFPARIANEFGTVAECKTRMTELYGADWLADALFDEAEHGAAVSCLKDFSCDAKYGDQWQFKCEFPSPVNLRKLNAACSDNAHCESGYCSGLTTTTCGLCASPTVATTGNSCGAGTICAKGSRCTDGVCVETRGEGESCDSKAKVCGTALNCKAGVCERDRALGASCEGAKCDVFFPGAFCSPSTKKCVVLERLSQAWGGCVVSGEGATCGPGLYCRPQDPEDEGLPPGATARLGVCHSRHADGKACTSSIECRHHSECRSNVCVLAKPERPTCL